MDHMYEQVLSDMEEMVNRLAERVPEPRRVPYGDSFVYRHREQLIGQAIVQKSARMVSTLRAARVLTNCGFVQEQAALQRILDEIQEDIHFLAFGVINSELTDLHSRYLDAFFEEEFDAEDAVGSNQKRPMIPRRKIRAHIARMQGAINDPSQGVDLSRTISKGYSGYVHAASPQIMDMYGGDPPRFYMRGMPGTERQQEHRDDLWSYFYRGVIALAFGALALGDQALFDEINDYVRRSER